MRLTLLFFLMHLGVHHTSDSVLYHHQITSNVTGGAKLVLNKGFTLQQSHT
jgi:hypothetical protein